MWKCYRLKSCRFWTDCGCICWFLLPYSYMILQNHTQDLFANICKTKSIQNQFCAESILAVLAFTALFFCFCIWYFSMFAWVLSWGCIQTIQVLWWVVIVEHSRLLFLLFLPSVNHFPTAYAISSASRCMSIHVEFILWPICIYRSWTLVFL